MLERIDYISKTLAELIKMIEKEEGRPAMLVYLLSMAMAEADYISRSIPRATDSK
ncbi:hypothetical protein OCK02_02065 [Rhizobium sp. TRM96647]|uniref:hypothetical protein n=1 Tax=unclassified Rhizobium TaxID=2613769 RepID=UPI0021E8D996|nr:MULTISPECIES: hypothetical protein [unclassified Rhizobium]MCV3734974.1 hypothetical protein [Rhizobium sp. TRM96647]MCV3757344.1 hypothetical protein [Rhizobium sp. TRM96650]